MGMNLWFIKDIKFGYRYTTSKKTRKNIQEYFDDYFIGILKKKATPTDKLIITGGLFQNTNPSIIAITDAMAYIIKLSNIIEVDLLTSQSDMRFFEGDNYSTLNMFKSFSNVNVIEYNSKNIFEYDKCTLNLNNTTVSINSVIIPLPSVIQYDEKDDNIGVFIYRTKDGKHTILNNKYSPKHITVDINTIADFSGIDISNNIHLIINDSLLQTNKSELEVNLFNVNPLSVKYISPTEEKKKVNILSDFNIINRIQDVIGDDTDVKRLFNNILNINKNAKY